MYNVQEREELDYFPQSESQNCYSEARMALNDFNAENKVSIDAYIAAGFYVLVNSFESQLEEMGDTGEVDCYILPRRR